MKKAIVTFANNEERYLKGVKRQEQSLKDIGFDGDYFCFKSFDEIWCPSHEDVPYAFKPYAIDKVRQIGYDIVLWMDSPVYATKDLTGIFKHIEANGYLFFDNIGFTVGDYTSDKCLDLFNITRDKAFKTQMIMACVMGFNFNKNTTISFFNKYKELADIEGYYEGDWKNDNKQVSKDERVKGHRHDQSVASILINQMGLNITHPHSTYFAYFNNPGHMPHAESVCLISHGY